jgi:hypothetical protein
MKQQLRDQIQERKDKYQMLAAKEDPSGALAAAGFSVDQSETWRKADGTEVTKKLSEMTPSDMQEYAEYAYREGKRIAKEYEKYDEYSGALQQ